LQTANAQEVKKMAEEAKIVAGANALPHKGHHHNPDAPHRAKYPADYDSASDYEVRKLGDVVKTIDAVKAAVEECKKQTATNNTHQ
jgi:hypothetical protein